MFIPGLIVEFFGILLLVFGILAGSIAGQVAGACLVVAAVGVHIVQIRKNRHAPGGTAATGRPPAALPDSPGAAPLLYEDGLITITGDAITFRNYSLLLKPRTVALADIDHIDVKASSITTGKYRMWGSGNFIMWFPLDSARSSRDRIFHAFLKIRGMSVGFTVERSAEVAAILRSRGLIGTEDAVP